MNSGIKNYMRTNLRNKLFIATFLAVAIAVTGFFVSQKYKADINSFTWSGDKFKTGWENNNTAVTDSGVTLQKSYNNEISKDKNYLASDETISGAQASYSFNVNSVAISRLEECRQKNLECWFSLHHSGGNLSLRISNINLKVNNLQNIPVNEARAINHWHNPDQWVIIDENTEHSTLSGYISNSSANKTNEEYLAYIGFNQLGGAKITSASISFNVLSTTGGGSVYPSLQIVSLATGRGSDSAETFYERMNTYEQPSEVYPTLGHFTLPSYDSGSTKTMVKGVAWQDENTANNRNIRARVMAYNILEDFNALKDKDSNWSEWEEKRGNVYNELKFNNRGRYVAIQMEIWTRDNFQSPKIKSISLHSMENEYYLVRTTIKTDTNVLRPGTASPKDQYIYPQNKTAAIIITPKVGYRVRTITDNGTIIYQDGSQNGQSIFDKNNNVINAFVVNSDHNLEITLYAPTFTVATETRGTGSGIVNPGPASVVGGNNSPEFRIELINPTHVLIQAKDYIDTPETGDGKIITSELREKTEINSNGEKKKYIIVPPRVEVSGNHLILVQIGENIAVQKDLTFRFIGCVDKAMAAKSFKLEFKKRGTSNWVTQKNYQTNANGEIAIKSEFNLHENEYSFVYKRPNSTEFRLDLEDYLDKTGTQTVKIGEPEVLSNAIVRVANEEKEWSLNQKNKNTNIASGMTDNQLKNELRRGLVVYDQDYAARLRQVINIADREKLIEWDVNIKTEMQAVVKYYYNFNPDEVDPFSKRYMMWCTAFTRYVIKKAGGPDVGTFSAVGLWAYFSNNRTATGLNGEKYQLIQQTSSQVLNGAKYGNVIIKPGDIFLETVKGYAFSGHSAILADAAFSSKNIVLETINGNFGPYVSSSYPLVGKDTASEWTKYGRFICAQ